MAETYVRCIVVETETEVPGLALIQIHDDQPPVHYVPLDDLIELSEERSSDRFRTVKGKVNPQHRRVSQWEPVDD